MRPRFITAYEHERLSVGSTATDAISEADALHLYQLGLKRPGFCTLGHRSVRLAQFAGLVKIDGRILEILPKVGDSESAELSRGTFLRLLNSALDTPLFSGTNVGHDLRRQSLLEVFIRAYLQELSMLVRRGLMRRYRNDEDDLPMVRGRLLIRRQVARHAMRVDQLACRFDDLDIDNPWNRVLKTALQAVRPWLRSIESGRNWIELNSAFDEVSADPQALPMMAALVSDRQSRHYGPALRWAEWILRLLSPSVRAGANEAPELLFDMNRLFESAVANLLRRRIGNSMSLETQGAGRHLAQIAHSSQSPAFRLRPDLIIRHGAEVRSVGDTKWSRVDIGGRGWALPKESHAYQMHAYASAYECDDFVLIYPWFGGSRNALPTAFNLRTTFGRSPVLHVVCIDVGRDGFPAVLEAEASALGSLFFK